jgi:hypothetical protein
MALKIRVVLFLLAFNISLLLIPLIKPLFNLAIYIVVTLLPLVGLGFWLSCVALPVLSFKHCLAKAKEQKKPYILLGAGWEVVICIFLLFFLSFRAPEVVIHENFFLPTYNIQVLLLLTVLACSLNIRIYKFNSPQIRACCIFLLMFFVIPIFSFSFQPAQEYYQSLDIKIVKEFPSPSGQYSVVLYRISGKETYGLRKTGENVAKPIDKECDTNTQFVKWLDNYHFLFRVTGFYVIRDNGQEGVGTTDSPALCRQPSL